ncbi:hypothetical protein GH714_024876 [Hevea brasiliensis]|uniref:Wall-associated receptor kinase C-terminal domain-containing protein n=1 Tax=Hevea brasiliensis TaxID=3981 RepID=A0A6A6LDZ2_HEVBR|nr:hypothetical protein GH714_024876 [Hevea brasiliensis]
MMWWDATLFYNCELSPEALAFNEFSCPINNVPRDAYLMVPTVSRNEFLLGCNISIAIPILARAVQGLLRAELTVIQVLNQGFEVRWILDQVQCGDCLRSGGRCGYNWTVNQFSCFCPDQAYSRTCPSPMPSGSLLNPGETTSESASHHSSVETCQIFLILSGAMSDLKSAVIKDSGSGAKKDLSENICPPGVAEIPSTTLHETPFSYVPELENVNLFYNCSNEVTKVPTLYKIPCAVNGEQRDAFYATDRLLSKWNQDPTDCNIRVEVPVPKVAVEQLSGGMEAFWKVLREGFNVTYMSDTIRMCYECVHSGGICGTNSSTSRFTCLCRDQPYPYNCPKGKAMV